MAACRAAAPLAALLLTVAAAFWPLAAAAQEPEAGAPARDTDFTFTLSKVIGQPGFEVSVPVLFGRKAGTRNVGSLRARISYPAAALKFNRIEDAYLSRRVKLEVKATESSADPATSALLMEFRLPDPQGTQFPSGHIATLYFNIAEGAADQVIHLNPAVWIDDVQVKENDPQTLIEVGEVRIAKDPVMVGCFFFSH
ncbi:MAG TPA: hypothetical protein VNN17_03270 [Terriglobia bacterium]|nr:hypothetical protein [Terriglobia bacterium]